MSATYLLIPTYLLAKGRHAVSQEGWWHDWIRRRWYGGRYTYQSVPTIRARNRMRNRYYDLPIWHTQKLRSRYDRLSNPWMQRGLRLLQRWGGGAAFSPWVGSKMAQGIEWIIKSMRPDNPFFFLFSLLFSAENWISLDPTKSSDL